MVEMRQRLWAGLIMVALAMFGVGTIANSIAQEGNTERRGTILTLDGPVTPATASYVEREIANASLRNEELVILELDTPGGLVDSMKTIIKAILASETPVVTYVYPQGARSASAGLYIMYGSHVAAMAPYTNTGSATPIQMGGPSEEAPSPFEDPAATDDDVTDGEATEEAPVDLSNEASLRGKIIEDSVAYIRGLAEERGRNAEWAEKAVRPPSASITATEALELGVIEIKAEDLEDLMEQLDGRVVTTIAGEKTLSTQKVALTRVEPTLIEVVLGFFSNPNVAAILFTLGTTGLIVEMWNPGSIFPGALGALCLILAFYSFQVLPYNGVYLGLMGLGMLLILVEVFTPSFGLIGLAGLLIFGAGLYFVFPEDFRVAPGVLAATLVAAGGFLFMVMAAFVGSRGHGPLIGKEAIRKRAGRVDEWDRTKGEGLVVVDGERWKARSKDDLTPGDSVKVQEIDGIVLIIRKTNAAPSSRLMSMLPSRAS